MGHPGPFTRSTAMCKSRIVPLRVRGRWEWHNRRTRLYTDMTPSELIDTHKSKGRKAPPAAWLFFLRWLANPRAVGSVTPSSEALRKIIARHLVCSPDEVIVEFGGGTGAITRAILDAGIPPNRLYVVEIDPELVDYLRSNFPGVNIIHGDCAQADRLIDAAHLGKVGTVVCGIPMSILPVDVQKEVVRASFTMMPKGRHLMLYTYLATSPLSMKTLGVRGKRLGWTAANFPPASVWGYTKPD